MIRTKFHSHGIRNPSASLAVANEQFKIIEEMHWFFGDGIFEIEVIENVMIYTFMSLETELTLYVESTAIDIANNTGGVQVLLLLYLLCFGHNEAVDYYSHNQGHHNLVN